MEAVWGTHAGPANSLDVLVNSLRGKLDAHRSFKMIVTVRGIGYRLNMGSSQAQFAGARS
jgi:DNA-binding response OmpR family regulator